MMMTPPEEMRLECMRLALEMAKNAERAEPFVEIMELAKGIEKYVTGRDDHKPTKIAAWNG